MHIDALILAAGPSTRLGEPKQLLDWGGPTLLGHVVAMVSSFPIDETWVVLGSGIEDILERVEFGDAGIIQNLEWEEGMASSLRVGLDTIAREAKADAVLIVLGDQPEVDPEVVRQLIDRYEETGAWAVIPKYRYQRGNPALIDRALWPRLMSLEGDQGARTLLQAHPEWVEEVWFSSTIPRDVDTARDAEDLHPDRHG
ncbi:nicotine blue oxidoreductase [bacterium BMS3Abin02]|nr:nicotine blue oxidoreductase [bacterium BMS3Abin02]GBE21461.1 nicotine blue oxidoreductase [bacterium BMS3Bbin01]HDH26904.1 nucleotidyltransferase family protein [Actinomycetota bacterium]HDK44791.1 nucleotidyltransferase family protein [Actinomycetota bacterium]HDL49333.1 nucleotidyltransferase family protein [Actinomycetota bacterium]